MYRGLVNKHSAINGKMGMDIKEEMSVSENGENALMPTQNEHTCCDLLPCTSSPMCDELKNTCTEHL